jgi:hypothetical protein
MVSIYIFEKNIHLVITTNVSDYAKDPDLSSYRIPVYYYSNLLLLYTELKLFTTLMQSFTIRPCQNNYYDYSHISKYRSDNVQRNLYLFLLIDLPSPFLIY